MAATSFYGGGVWHDGLSAAAQGTGSEPKTAGDGRDERNEQGQQAERQGWDWSDYGGEWIWRSKNREDRWQEPKNREDRWQEAAWGNYPSSWTRRSSWGDSWTSTSAETQGQDRGDPWRDPGGDGDEHPHHGSEDGSDRRPPPRDDRPSDGGRGPSEKMIVPSFSGEGDGDELGSSARSYLRQVLAWQRMTKVTKDKQALVLYQHLSGAAWVEAERLEVDRLGASGGMDYFTQWVKDRYLDVQVTQVGRSLSEFFRRLKKKPSQSIRDYGGEFDRAYAQAT